MQFSAVKYWLLFVAVLGAIYASFVAWRGLEARTGEGVHTPAVSPAKPQAPGGPVEFTLTDENGQPFDSKSLQGNVWVGSFFFTNCPGSCWRLNQALAALQQENPDSETRIISITCDPDNDHSEDLLRYAKHFKADPKRWTFLTGDFDLIQKIGNEFFQVAVGKATHSDRAFVVDRSGQVRGRFLLTDPHQVELLKRLLAVVEAEPPAESKPADSPTAPAQPEAARAAEAPAST